MVRQPTRPRWPTFDEAALLAGATNTERANIERILPHKLALQADYCWRSTKPMPLIDGAVVALAWNVTYLFHLGFER